MRASWHDYLKSLSAELLSTSERVRNLIGDSHWISDGQHKENLLISVLSRHLPFGMIAGRGFVLSPNDENECSNEQDILIVDSLKECPVFNEGGLIVAFPGTVRAAISVKSTLGKTELENSIAGLNSVRILCEGCNELFWAGAFFFKRGDKTNSLPYTHMKPFADQCKWIDMFCAMPDLIYRTDKTENGELSTRGFSCGSLAAGIFIAELIDHLAYCRDKKESDMTQIATLVDDICSIIDPD